MSGEQEGLPDGWEVTRVGLLADTRMGKTITAKSLSADGIPVYSAGRENRPWGRVSTSNVLFGESVVVLSARGSIGFPKLPAEVPFVSTQTTIAADFGERTGAEFYRHWLRTIDWQALTSGGSIPMLTVGLLDQQQAPVPPLNEQRRIVAKIESLQARSKAAKEALDAIPPLLEKFRQSVLAAAFRGDLTKEWRAQNPDVEPASVLLERIRAERRTRWIADAAEKGRARAEARARKAGKSWNAADDEKALEKERVKAAKKYKEPEPVDAEGLPELPEGWCWASVDEASELVTSGSRGWGKYYSEDGALFLRVGNLDRNTVLLDLTKLAYVRPPEGAEGERTRVRAGDVLLSITADVGMVGVAPSGLGEAFINQHVALIRPAGPVNSRCLGYSLADPCGLQALVKEIQYGATKASLSLTQVRGFPVPLPPLGEQDVIEQEVDRLLGIADASEAALAAGGANLSSLNQSILAKAFRGELVPQDPDDEPASVLLERIRAEREAAKRRRRVSA